MDEWAQSTPRAPFGRIVRITKRDDDGWPAEGLLQLVPDSHRIFVCPDCLQIFTQPREGEAVFDVPADFPRFDVLA